MDRPYVDYAYYSGEYAGTSISETEFTAFARKASLKMDTFTFGRLSSWPSTDFPDSVFDACCAIAEVLYAYEEKQNAITEATANGAIKSESNDGYSVSFGAVDRVADEAAVNKEVRGLIETYLGHTGLLFRGLSRRWDMGVPTT